MAVRSSRDSEGESGGSSAGRPMKSLKDGMALFESLKYVGRLRFVFVAVRSGGEVSVARVRILLQDVRVKLLDAWRNGGACRQRKREAVAAIVRVLVLRGLWRWRW